MTRHSSTLLALALTTALASAVHAADASPPAATVAAVKRAVTSNAFADIDALVAARAEAAAAADATPASAALHYWVAYADYRLAPRLMDDRKKDARRWLDDGIEHLDRALAIDGGFVEAIALRASLQGLSIWLAPTRAMSLAGEIEEQLERARALAPENPRVVLIDGINTLNKPGFAGGGAKKALPLLTAAQQRFADTPPASDPAAIDWGHDDAYAWAGRALVKLGRKDEARAAYRKALELNPGNGWVANVLMPKLDQAASR